MIKVSHLFYDYPGLRALDDVSFELPSQSITALVGPNGAGKTTLLRSMVALDEPTSGEIHIDGVNVWEHPREAHLRMGYLPDHFGLYQELTAYQCLTYAAWTHGLRGEQMRQAVQWAIQQVGLKEQLPKLASTLSRGQRQRLALAQAIVHRPKVLFMDEPASGLDPEARAALSSLMKNLAAQGMTLLISSHILAELETYCTAMLVLEQGRILAYQKIGDGGTSVPVGSTGRVADTSASAVQKEKVLRISVNQMQQTRLDSLCQWLAARGVRAQVHEGKAVLVSTHFADEAAQTQLLRDLLADGWEIIEYAPQTQSLQDVYMQTVASRRQMGGK
ncbi:ABC transporter ATP-binding protein [Saezia sanguinis]|uniref:ABC transporter ATP-binding protein n=1 Tax=Saezia sanguinis TaxID=1965230 RepID=UPI0030712E02